MKTKQKSRIKMYLKKTKKRKINGGRISKYDGNNNLLKGDVHIKKLRCSPKKKGKKNNFSCYTDESLYKLRNLWNMRHPDVVINTNDTKEIHTKLKNILGGVCNKESCWLKQQFAEGKIRDDLENSFAPESPKEWKKNPNDWLSSLEIIQVMKQYEKAYDCFEFIGPSPIDFDKKKLYGECVWEELCHFSLAKQIENGKTKIGIIFNTDPHDKPGQHWMSMFINIPKRTIFFFDSVGDKAPKEIMKLVKRIQMEGLKLQKQNKNKANDNDNDKDNDNHKDMRFKFDQNYPVEHQYGNTECGVYSLFFIVHLLEDKLTEEYFKTHIIKDEYMQKFRKIYFNDEL